MANIAKAVAHLSTDWDSEPTTEVYMQSELARKLLRARGWTNGGPLDPKWVSPDREVYCWDVSEALTIALIAEVI